MNEIQDDAAKEMLEALKGVMSWYTSTPPHEGLVRCMEIAAAAIAKAEARDE